MLFALHPIDYGVLALYLTAVLAIGFYCRWGQRSALDLLLTGRTMDWFPIGLSIAATLLSGVAISELPGEAYRSGLKLLLVPVAIWFAMPFLHWIFLPLCRGLQLCSVYEYLELRFDLNTRRIAVLLFVGWKLLWMGCVLAATCKILTVAANVDIPLWVPIFLTGLISTSYSFLGGMKAIIWSDVLKICALSTGIVAVICVTWLHLEGGPSRVWQVATALERTDFVDVAFRLDSDWGVWGSAPHFVLSLLAFYVADQVTSQRFLTVRTLQDARRSFLFHGAAATVLIAGLAYVGLCLLAFYHDHPSQLRTKWIVNVDGESGRSLTFADRDHFLGNQRSTAVSPPLLEWDNPAHEVTAGSVERLIADQRLLHPNRKTPFQNAREIFDEANPERLDIEKLMTRHPPTGKLKKGEAVLNTKAKVELVPWFVATQLPFGIAGVVVAAFFAAAMSSLDSGLNAICSVAIFDLYRGCRWGRALLAMSLRKPQQELNEADELRLAKLLILTVGFAVTLSSMIFAQSVDILEIVPGVISTFGAPLLGLFLLGICTSRTTAPGALLGLTFGLLFTIWLVASSNTSAFAWLWPFDQKLGNSWHLPIGTVCTFVCGFSSSFVCGTEKTRSELRGLVLGCGRLGTREK